MHPRLLAQTMRGMTPVAPGIDTPARAASPLHVVVSAS
jgi:hypothetical protein